MRRKPWVCQAGGAGVSGLGTESQNAAAQGGERQGAELRLCCQALEEGKKQISTGLKRQRIEFFVLKKLKHESTTVDCVD